MADEYSAKPTIRKPSPTTQSEKPSPKHKFEGHKDRIWSFVFLHDNKHIVSGSADGTMCKWQYHTGLLVGEPWKGEGGDIWALALSPDGKTIACGRDDGSIQQWNTDGKMIKDVWRHSNSVPSVSWSPDGGHIASGSSDGKIQTQKAKNSKIKMGPIATGQNCVYSLAYTPSGDRIASGGEATICIWDSNTSDLLVGPITDLGASVTSVVWSSDSSKLYSASDKFARVFDSVSGAEFHRFEHNHSLFSIALSPKQKLLACVGFGGTAQLWDTETYQPLRKPFSPEDSVRLEYVSFSRDGRYLAYGGDDKKITLWLVEDIVPQFALPASATQEEILPKPAALSYLDVDATNPFAQPDDIEDGQDDPYNCNFLQSSHSSLYSSSSGSSPIRWLWRVIVVASLLSTPANESVPLQERLKRRFLIRRARSPPSPLETPANNGPTEPKPDRKVRAREDHDKDVHLPDHSANIIPGAAKHDKGKQREDVADPKTLPPDDASSTAEFNTNENLTFPKFLRALGKNATTSLAQMTSAQSPKVVEVSACRKHQGHVAVKRKHKSKSSILRISAFTTAAQANGSSQAGPYSHGRPAHGNTSSLGQAAGVSSHSIAEYGGQSLQVAGSITTADGLSDSASTQGFSWNRFLDRMCFPCGHFEDD